jgi:hypothetical protein
MIHFDKNNSFFVLIGVGFNLYAYSLPELIKQAKEIHNFNVLTILN